MKKLRLGMMTLIMCMLSFVSYGQDRVNREKLSFSETSQCLYSATGWVYNKSLGEWIDYKNVISEDKSFKDEYKSLQGEFMMSETDQNFISLQTKTFIYKGEKYFALVINKYSGRYKYPAIKEDWMPYKQTNVFVFSSNEYSKLYNLTKNTLLETTYADYGTSDKFESDDTVLFNIISRLENKSIVDKIESDDLTYKFYVKLSDPTTVKFLLPIPRFSSYKISEITDKYFETSLENFNKFIIK